MNSRQRYILAIAGALLAVNPGAPGQTSVGTSFTYQGQLKQNGAPVEGHADFQFVLHDAATGGTNLGSAGFLSVPVVNGQFQVDLDFGHFPFDGEARWLEILMRFPAGIGEVTALSPRQMITNAPYAIHTRGVHVDVQQNVGLGTKQPRCRLHLANEIVTVPVGASSSDDLMIGSTDAEIGLYSTTDGSWGSAVTLAEIADETLIDKWTMVRRASSGGSGLRFTYGSGAPGIHNTNILHLGADGRVGVGTELPNATLHVGKVGSYYWGDGDGWGDFSINDGTVGLGIGVATSGTGTGDVYLWPKGGVQRLKFGNPDDGVIMTIRNAKVGIGTTNPLATMHIADGSVTPPNAALVSDDLIISSTDAELSLYSTDLGSWGSIVSFNELENGELTDKWSIVRNTAQQGSGLRFTYGTDYTAWGNTGILQLGANGRIGIGTGSPDASLHINNIGSYYWGYGEGLGDFTLSNGVVGFSIGVATTGTGKGDVYLWPRGGTERVVFGNPTDGQILTIDNARVGIGTTSPDYALDVNGDIQCVAVHETSDARFKVNVATVTRSLAKVLGLRGVTFDWNTTAFPERGFNDRRQVGFIAQEVASVVPEAVSHGEDGSYAVNYGRIVPVLVEAIKELRTELEARDAKIEALSARLERVESIIARETDPAGR